MFEKYIEDEEENKIEGLGIIDLYAKIDRTNRFNSLFIGTLRTNKNEEEQKFKIMGYKSTFSFSYGNNSKNYAFKSIKGCGINKESKLEGIRINNFFGTYLIGPLLIINPDFTKYIMKLLGKKEPKLQFEDKAQECYNARLLEFENIRKLKL